MCEYIPSNFDHSNRDLLQKSWSFRDFDILNKTHNTLLTNKCFYFYVRDRDI